MNDFWIDYHGDKHEWQYINPTIPAEYGEPIFTEAYEILMQQIISNIGIPASLFRGDGNYASRYPR